VLVSIVQRNTALTAPQKTLLQDVSQRAARSFRRLDDVEWVITKEKLAVTVTVRFRAQSGVFRARATQPTFSKAVHEAAEKVLSQRTRTKRDVVDRRDDTTVKGRARRVPRRA
jgi:ribosome-associated translation inhibitor RaiA